MLTLYELVLDSDTAVEVVVVGIPTGTTLAGTALAGTALACTALAGTAHSLVGFPFVHGLISALPVSVPLGLFVVNKRSEVVHLPWPLLPLVRPVVEMGGDHPFGRICPSSTVCLA